MTVLTSGGEDDPVSVRAASVLVAAAVGVMVDLATEGLSVDRKDQLPVNRISSKVADEVCITG